jgi:hypothetical protein
MMPQIGIPFPPIRAKLPRVRNPAICSLVALALLASPACSIFKSEKPDEPEKKPAPEAPRLVGRIASVPADKRFVLIQSYGTWNAETGTILTTRGPDERTANLLVTGESLGHFAAADLQSGAVEVGDAVYSRHLPKSPETQEKPAVPTEVPENQPRAEVENVQKNN